MGQPEYVLAETELEERDGVTWVSGLCPACCERFAFYACAPGANAHVQCLNGHLLRIFVPDVRRMRAAERQD